MGRDARSVSFFIEWVLLASGPAMKGEFYV